MREIGGADARPKAVSTTRWPASTSPKAISTTLSSSKRRPRNLSAHSGLIHRQSSFLKSARRKRNHEIGWPLWNRDLVRRSRGAVCRSVLIHGFPLDHTMWTEQIDALLRSQRLTSGVSPLSQAGEGPGVRAVSRVLAPDLRGFGCSPLGTTEGRQGHDGPVRRRSGRLVGRPGDPRTRRPLRAVDGRIHRFSVLAGNSPPVCGG